MSAAAADGSYVQLLRVSTTTSTRTTLAGTDRVLLPVTTPRRFRLLGLQWRGDPGASFAVRVGGPSGPLGRWQELDHADGPDSAPRGRRRPFASDPLWVGSAVRLQVRVHGAAAGIRAVVVDPGRPALPPRRPSTGSDPGAGAQSPAAPAIISRGGWGADEALRRADPLYASALRFAVVHHTAGTNDYTPDQSSAIVRGIYLYHVRGNGWNDIGYNFLVDRFGQVFEGRFGGVDRNVIGAHAGGFNTGATGVALLGSFESATPPSEQIDALQRVLAWRLDVGHVDPASSWAATSGGNERFGPGQVVTLATISGHRDTGSTTCPGGVLYSLLPAIRSTLAALPAPRLYDPSVLPSPAPVDRDGRIGPVRFTARLSAAVPWRIRILAADGSAVAVLPGAGTVVDATWDGRSTTGLTLPPPSTLRWRIEAGPTYLESRAATGSFGNSPPPAAPTPSATLAGVSAEPSVISPNGDGVAETGSVRWTQSAPGQVRVSVLDNAGAEVAVPGPAHAAPAGEQVVTWDGRRADGATAPSGVYTYRIEVAAAAPGGTALVATAPVAVRRSAGGLTVTPLFSPNADGRADRAVISYTQLEPGPAQVRLWQRGRLVATIAGLDAVAGPWSMSWDGGGQADGAYLVQLLAPSAGGAISLRAPLVIDRSPPELVVRPLVLRRRLVRVRVHLSEPATLYLRNGTRTLARITRKAGWFGLVVRPRALRRARTMTIFATDLAGNRSSTRRLPVPH